MRWFGRKKTSPVKGMVSICVPTCNGADYLQDTFNSILTQTYRDIEIIIVDDNSTDNTIKIVREMTHGVPGVKIIKNPVRLGLGGNWNKCMEMATGEWIKFAFQDDLLSPDCIEKLHGLATRTNNIMAVCGRDFIFQENIDAIFQEKFLNYIKDNCITNRFPHHSEAISAEDFAVHVEKYPVFNCIGEPTAVMFHRSVISRFGKFNVDLTQIIDWEYWMRVAINKGFCFTREKLATFRLHNKGTSARNRSEAELSDLINELIVYHELYYSRYYDDFRKRIKHGLSIKNLMKSKLINRYASIQSILHQYPDNENWLQLMKKYRLKENFLFSMFHKNIH